MIPRRVLIVLVGVLIVLCVSCAVLLGFETLFESLGDATGARVLRWVGVTCLLLLAVDLLLLVGALGVNSLYDRRGEADE